MIRKNYNLNKLYIEIAKSLTPKERKIIIDQIFDKSCINCTNRECRVEYGEKIGYNKFGEAQGTGCIGWENDSLIGEHKLLVKSKFNKQKKNL